MKIYSSQVLRLFQRPSDLRWAAWTLACSSLFCRSSQVLRLFQRPSDLHWVARNLACSSLLCRSSLSCNGLLLGYQSIFCIQEGFFRHLIVTHRCMKRYYLPHHPMRQGPLPLVSSVNSLGEIGGITKDNEASRSRVLNRSRLFSGLLPKFKRGAMMMRNVMSFW